MEHPDWTQLPEAVLVLILQHVSQEQRLCSCALVCGRWAAAAVSATAPSVSVALAAEDYAKHVSLSAWLAAHGSTTTSLEVRRIDPHPTLARWDFAELPCAKLRRLHLEGCSIRRSSLSTPGILQHSSQLEELALIVCATDDSDPLCSITLASLPAPLQALTLQYCPALDFVETPEWAEVPRGARSGLPASFLQNLSRLSCLTSLAMLDNMSAASLQHISVLSTVRSLQLSPRWYKGPESRTALSELSTLTQLTELKVSWRFGGIIGLDVAPLIQLLRLELANISRHLERNDGGDQLAAAVAHLTQLQHLCVASMPTEPLLQVLQQLQQLTSLLLEPPVFDTMPLEAFTNLTAASSSLRQLDFRWITHT